jgi:hypothetical protein
MSLPRLLENISVPRLEQIAREDTESSGRRLWEVAIFSLALCGGDRRSVEMAHLWSTKASASSSCRSARRREPTQIQLLRWHFRQKLAQSQRTSDRAETLVGDIPHD